MMLSVAMTSVKKLWTGFTKEGSSLERTKVVKVSTLTFTSVHVGIEVQRKI